MSDNKAKPLPGDLVAPVETSEATSYSLPPSLELAVTANLKRAGHPTDVMGKCQEAMWLCSHVRIAVRGEHVGYIVMAQDGTLSLQDVKFGIIYQISPVTLWHALVRALNPAPPPFTGEEKNAEIVTLPVDTDDSGA